MWGPGCRNRLLIAPHPNPRPLWLLPEEAVSAPALGLSFFKRGPPWGLPAMTPGRDGDRQRPHAGGKSCTSRFSAPTTGLWKIMGGFSSTHLLLEPSRRDLPLDSGALGGPGGLAGAAGVQDGVCWAAGGPADRGHGGHTGSFSETGLGSGKPLIFRGEGWCHGQCPQGLREPRG